MGNKKVVFFTGAMARGGAERVISIISNHLAKKGWNVTIILLLKNIANGYELDKSIKIVSLELENNRFRLAQILHDVVEIRKFLKREKPDVVVSFMRASNVISWLACKGRKVRYIASERNDPIKAKMGYLPEKVLQSAYENAEKVIFQTERARSCFNEKIQKNGVIIGNPVSVVCEADKEKKKKFVAVGRLMPQKNHKILIDAFSDVVKLHPDYTLEIYGDGTLHKTLEKQISELNLDKNVFLKGNVSNVHECIKDAGAFVLSSDFEGTSNALLEAMLMGHVCISTDCAGSDEIIKDGENGFLIPVGDKEKLVKAILKVIEDKENLQDMGEKAKESVQRFKKENIIDKWMKVIEGGENVD